MTSDLNNEGDRSNITNIVVQSICSTGEEKKS